MESKQIQNLPLQKGIMSWSEKTWKEGQWGGSGNSGNHDPMGEALAFYWRQLQEVLRAVHVDGSHGALTHGD